MLSNPSSYVELGSLLINRFGDAYYYGLNRDAFERTGADAVYNSRWGKNLFRENTLYLIGGTDSGVLPKYIVKNGIPDGSRYVFFEPDELIEPLKIHIESADNHNIAIRSVQDWELIVHQYAFGQYVYLDNVKIIKSIAVEDANYPSYSDFWRDLISKIELNMWQYRSEFGNCTFIARHLDNIAENRCPASLLKNKFKGNTAVLLAGGPSLDQILPWVIEHRSQLLILAVSRISRRLQQLDLEPDMIVTVDPHHSSFDVSKHMLNFNKCVLINAYHASPLLVSQFRGRSLYLNNRFPWSTRNEKPNITGIGPTVSHAALSLLIEMGFSQIILAGLDLCFSPEGFSHAQGSDERSMGAFVAYGNHLVKTNSGQTAETDNSFFNGIKSIESLAKLALSKNCQFINPSAHAAQIPNVKYIPLSEIEYAPLNSPAHKLFSQILPVETKESRIHSYQSAIAELNQAKHKLSKLKNLAKKAQDYNKGLFGRDGREQNFKYKHKMDKIEKRIQFELKDISEIAKIFGMAEFVKLFRPDTTREWTDEEIEHTGDAFYNAYICGADNVMPHIDSELELLDIRIEEEKPQPDFNKIFAHWERNQQYGRSVIWKRQHSEKFAQLPEDIKKEFQRLENMLNVEIAKKDHGYMAEIRQFAALRGVAGKAFGQFQNKDVLSLKRLLRGLETRNEPEAKDLHNLVNGFLAEVEERQHDAIQYFQTIIEHSECNQRYITENALLRLSVLVLGEMDLELGNRYLQRLSELSPSYMPQYAEMLRITNQYEEAINVYTDYLEKVPDDLGSMLRLGLMYQKIGALESARWVFNHIIEKDPHNQAARSLLKEVEIAS